jgi:hypothetical protein
MVTQAEAVGRLLDGAQALPATTEPVERYLKVKGGDRGKRIVDDFGLEFQTQAALQLGEGCTEDDLRAALKRSTWLIAKIGMEAGALGRDIHQAILRHTGTAQQKTAAKSELEVQFRSTFASICTALGLGDLLAGDDTQTVMATRFFGGIQLQRPPMTGEEMQEGDYLWGEVPEDLPKVFVALVLADVGTVFRTLPTAARALVLRVLKVLSAGQEDRVSRHMRGAHAVESLYGHANMADLDAMKTPLSHDGESNLPRQHNRLAVVMLAYVAALAGLESAWAGYKESPGFVAAAHDTPSPDFTIVTDRTLKFLVHHQVDGFLQDTYHPLTGKWNLTPPGMSSNSSRSDKSDGLRFLSDEIVMFRL